MKIRSRIIIGVMILAILIGSIVPVKQTEAASKVAFYYSFLTGKKYQNFPYTKSMNIKGRKLIIKASFDKCPNSTVFSHDNSVRLKFKKRTFKLSKNCKFYCVEEGENVRISKKEFLRTAHYYSGLGLKFVTNSRGQIYKMIVSP